MKPRRAISVYSDTSVYGGVFDPEFQEASRSFFDQVETGRFELIVSLIVTREAEQAPARVRALIDRMAQRCPTVELSEDMVHLQEAYLRAGIVTPRWEADALHVACATVAGCRMLVSWNFRHIVHFDKIALYNAINVAEGYAEIGIYTPQEVIDYEDQDV